MAWISGLAGKAENILNKLDQNAATALQVASSGTTSENNTLDAMRRSLSNSTLSIKAALSPVKVRGSSSSGNSRAGSVKNENISMAPSMTDSVESKEKVEWNIYADTAASSRRSSINSKTDSIAIDVENGVTQEPDAYNKHNKLKKVATEGIISKALTFSAASADSQELAAFKIALNEVTNERDELRARISVLSREVENATSWQRIQELEVLLQRLTEERDQAQRELSDIQSTNNAYVHSISDLESNLGKLQQEYMELAQKLQMQLKENEHQRKELQDYRVKAQLALQIKDNLIAELKTTAGLATTGSDESEQRVLQMEFDALKQEHQQKLEECDSLCTQVEVMRRDWSKAQEQHTEQLAAAQANEDLLRKELRSEREHLLAVESEQRLQIQETVKLRQQLSNQMAASATRLQEKEQELQQLRAEVTRRKLGNTSDGTNGTEWDDYSGRMKTLTQTLVEKQQTVERITAERNALRIQLEKVQDQVHQNMLYSGSNSGADMPRHALLSNSTDDVKAQFPLLMRENPFDNRVARRVKRVYSSLDSAGIRLGAFLRRYPLMRVFVLMYVALLHLWVMFVLLSSTPN